jgi:AcrR family transcriptional regulator
MARNQKQNDKMRKERKEQIRAEALRQFAAQGLFATHIADIAAGVGMAQGLLYHYYSSKDAIFVDLVDNALDKLNEASIFVRDMQASAREKILFALRELLKIIETSEKFCNTCRLIAQAMNSTAIPEDAHRLIKEKRDIPYQAMATVMEAGQREGSVISGDPRMLATLFWTNVNGLAIYFATRKEAGEMPDYRILASMFLKDMEFDKEE